LRVCGFYRSPGTLGCSSLGSCSSGEGRRTMGNSDLEETNITAESVQVRYTVNTNDPGHRARGLRRNGHALRGRQGQTTVRALRGVNFVAREGEMVGIEIGRAHV